VEELTALGSGFSIAMKDLEIRGAGNILGPEQSGHIGAVGYDMFCRLLRSATAQVKQEAVVRPDEEVDLALSVAAFLPEEYVPDPQVRLEVLREMDRSVSKEAWTGIRASLIDRFGQLPAPAENLLTVFLVKHLLLALSVRGVHFIAPDQLMVRHPPARPLSGDWIAFFAEARPVEPGRTHLVLPRAVREPADVLAFLRASLLGEEEAGRMARAWSSASLSPVSPRSARRPRRRT
jgi:transcription-repair coupling factor (superfamily II helicase)